MASDGELTEECARLIPLADIDPRDERFRITTRRDSDDLHLSIGRLGLLAAAAGAPRRGRLHHRERVSANSRLPGVGMGFDSRAGSSEGLAL